MLSPVEILQRAREATGLAEPTHAGRRPAAAGKAPRVPFALLVTGLIIGALALLLALNTASAANELERHDLNRHDADVAARVQDLKIQVAASGAPANLAAAAAALGMVPAGNPAFVVIGADGKARVMGSPEAATEAPVPVPVKPKPSATKKPKPTATPDPTKATSGAASKSNSKSMSKSKSASPSTSTSKKSKSPSAPSSTPTPVVTLPGGTR